MGCNQSLENQQMSHFQQQQYQQQYQQFCQQQMQMQQTQSQPTINRVNSEVYFDQKIKEDDKPKQQSSEVNNKTLEKKQNNEYELLRKQSILKKTQKIIQENLLCSQQINSNVGLSTRRHYQMDKQDLQFIEYNRQNTQPNLDDDTSDEENFNKENMNPNLRIRQKPQNDYDKNYSTTPHQKGQNIQTMQDKINDHLRQVSNGGYTTYSNNQQQNCNKQGMKKNMSGANLQQIKMSLNSEEGQEEPKISKNSQRHIQKVHATKPKKFLQETHGFTKEVTERKVEVFEQKQQLQQAQQPKQQFQQVQQQMQHQQQHQQQQQRVLNFQNKLHLLTMRQYSSSESSQNTSYQKITQRYNNQLSQNSSYIFNQSNSLFNFRTGKTYEQCRQLYGEIEQLVKSRCSVHQFDAYHRFNTLIDKITQKNGEIKVHIITDSSSNYLLSSPKSGQSHCISTKNVGSGSILKISNEIVNFEQFELIESYLDENCISYDRRFFAKCVNNVKQLASLITQINFVFNYNVRPQSNSSSSSSSNSSSSQCRTPQNKPNSSNIKIGESFSIEIKVQRPFEEEQLNALSKQHSEYENIYEWYKINQASALGYGFVVNSSFRDEIYTFYIYHDDKNINLQKALSAFSMYGATMNQSVQHKLESIIPCNDFDIDFHFNQFGLVSIKLNLGKLSSNYETQLLNLYHTQISNCGSVKQFRGIERNSMSQSIGNQIRMNLDSLQNKQTPKYSLLRNSQNGFSNVNSSKGLQNSKRSSSRENYNNNQQQHFNLLNSFNNNFNINTLYSIEFNKQGFHLCRSDQVGQEDSASNTQIVICEQFK